MPKILITFFGLGLVPLAPGTWGSLGAAAVWIALRTGYDVLGLAPIGFDPFMVVLLVSVGAGTIAWAPWAVTRFGREDPRQCVSDEVAGQWLALLWLPVTQMNGLLPVVGVQFVLFRVFDIVKPPPARQAESLPAGWGILMDDLAAGVYANLLGQILFRCVWPLGR